MSKFAEELRAVSVINTEIIESKEYSRLKPFSTNRYGGFESQEEYTTEKEKAEFSKHVNEIKESMLEFGKERGFECGLFDPREPIIAFNIGGELLIGDGQHRAAAARELGIPFYVMIIQSPYGVGVGDNKRDDANDIEYAQRYFERMNKEMQMRWTAESKLSTCARNENRMAQYICNLAKEKKYFAAKTINDRVKFPFKNKKNQTVVLKALDYYNRNEGNFTNDEFKVLTDKIDEFVNIVEKLTYAFYDNQPFKRNASQTTKDNWLTKTMNYKYLGFAVLWVLKNPKLAKSLGFDGWNNVIKRIKEQHITRDDNHVTPQLFLKKFGLGVSKEDLDKAEI